MQNQCPAQGIIISGHGVGICVTVGHNGSEQARFPVGQIRPMLELPVPKKHFFVPVFILRKKAIEIQSERFGEPGMFPGFWGKRIPKPLSSKILCFHPIPEIKEIRMGSSIIHHVFRNGREPNMVSAAPGKILHKNLIISRIRILQPRDF